MAAALHLPSCATICAPRRHPAPQRVSAPRAAPCTAGPRQSAFAGGPGSRSGSSDAARGAPLCAAQASASSAQTVRVLRYPNGDERRIIYPSVDDAAASAAARLVEPVPLTVPPVPSDDEEFIPAMEDEAANWNECGLAGAACHVLDADPLVEELAERRHRPKHANMDELVGSSYQVLSGSPWLLPRPLFVLAQQSLFGGDSGTLYALQARMEQRSSMDEMTMVLKMPDLSARLSYAKLRDGVVAFDTAEDAARYATWLEAEMYGQVEVMEVDSHQLFKLTGGSDAVVVYLPDTEADGATGFLPMPQQLAKALHTQA